MSNIPLARAKLKVASALIVEATTLLDRRKPDFKTRDKFKALTPAQIARAKALRKKRLSINEIASILGTNYGRISEAISGRKKNVN